MDREKTRQKLKKKLRAKIEERQIQRTTKEQRDKILDDTLKAVGIDKKRFMDEMETMKKAGGNYSFQ